MSIRGQGAALLGPPGNLGGPPSGDSRARTSWFRTYGLAFLAVTLTTVLQLQLVPIFQGRLPFILFFAAVAITAWLGGFKPGLLAVVLSALSSAYFFQSPAFSLAIGFNEGLQLGVFILVGSLITTLNELRRQAQADSQLQREELHVTLASIGDAVIATNLKGQVTFMNGVAERLTGWTQVEAMGRPLQKVFRVINSITRLPIQNPVDRVVRIGRAVDLNDSILLITRDGREIPIDDNIAPIRATIGTTRGVVLVFRDISPRQQAEAALNRAAERTARLQAVTAALSEALTPGQVAQVVVQQGMPVLDASAGFVCLLNESRTELEIIGSVGYSAETANAWQRFAVTPGLPISDAVRTGQPIWLESKEMAYTLYPNLPPDTIPTYGARAAVPLTIENRVIGAIGLNFTGARVFSLKDRQFTMALAGQCAQALERARLYEEARAEIAARKLTEAPLKASLQEKEVLLKEVHHRVKNNLQAVFNLVYLQAAHTQDESTREILKQTQGRIRSIALIHEKLYQSKDLSRIDFAEYVRSLVTYLIHAHLVNPETINLKVNVVDTPLDIDTAVPLGVIISELISNALKYAFLPGQPLSLHRPNEISIDLHPDGEGGLLLTVSDNGIGLPEEVDLAQAHSLGLQLVRMLSEHMQGTLEVERSNGTTFKLKLALSSPAQSP